MPAPIAWYTWHRGAHYEGDACLPNDPYHHDHQVLYSRYPKAKTDDVEDSDSLDQEAMISEGGNAWT